MFAYISTILQLRIQRFIILVDDENEIKQKEICIQNQMNTEMINDYSFLSVKRLLVGSFNTKKKPNDGIVLFYFALFHNNIHLHQLSIFFSIHQMHISVPDNPCYLQYIRQQCSTLMVYSDAIHAYDIAMDGFVVNE